MIDFLNVKSIVLPQGEVSKIERGSEILWQKQKYKTELEYLESTGTQYINTGWNPGANAGRFTFDIEVQNTKNVVGHGALGSRSVDVGRNWVITNIHRELDNKIVEQFGYGSIYQNLEIESSDKWTRAKTYIDNSNYVFEATCDDTTSTNNTPLQIFTNTANIYLFGINNKGSLFSNFPFIGKIRKAKLYDSGILVRDFIPVLDMNDRPCMYDKVTDKCFYNQGTGEFLYKVKPKYQELQYLESTGTQWIDTGYRINNNSRVELVINLLGSNNCDVFGCRGSKANVNLKNVSVTTGTGSLFVIDFTNSNYAQYRVSTTENTNSCKAKIVVSKNERSITNLDINKVLGSNTTLCKDVFICDTNAYLLYVSGQAYFEKPTQKAKIYSLKIEENGVLVRDMIPVLDNENVPCMYDKVSGEFYYNQGSGEFNYA